MDGYNLRPDCLKPQLFRPAAVQRSAQSREQLLWTYIIIMNKGSACYAETEDYV